MEAQVGVDRVLSTLRSPTDWRSRAHAKSCSGVARLVPVVPARKREEPLDGRVPRVAAQADKELLQGSVGPRSSSPVWSMKHSSSVRHEHRLLMEASVG